MTHSAMYCSGGTSATACTMMAMSKAAQVPQNPRLLMVSNFWVCISSSLFCI